MEKDVVSSRLKALDGLRGIAIMYVFFSHVGIPLLLPPGIFSTLLFGDGFLGVSFLFILSGFLMASIYPNAHNASHFLQKRYTRIFPLFIAVCLGRVLIWIINPTIWYQQISVLIITAIVIYFIWTYIGKRLSKTGKKTVFFIFLLIQISVGLYYLWVAIHPPSDFFNNPNLIKIIIILFVNSTLTFPISTYAQIIDPVFWSLAAEVLFYILYPFIFVPLIEEIHRKSNILKILLFLSTLPLILGIYIISNKILYLHILGLYFFVYFICGMTLGYIYRNYRFLTTYSNKFINYTSPLLFAGIIYFVIHNIHGSADYSGWIILSIPTTCAVFLLLNGKNLITKFMANRLFVYLGTISYSFYLTHFFMLKLMLSVFGSPQNSLDSLVRLIGVLLGCILLASVLYWLLERPYFNHKEKHVGIYVQKALATGIKHPRIIFTTTIVILLLVVFFIYQSDTNFFSFEQRIPDSGIYPTVNKNKVQSLKDYPTLTINIQSAMDNLGIIELPVQLQADENKTNDKQTLIFKIKEKGTNKWYSTSNYNIDSKNQTITNIFGFPLIHDSKGKIYEIAISESYKDSMENVILDTSNEPIKAVFVTNKSAIIHNPFIILSLLSNKLANIIVNNNAKYVMLLFTPFMLLSLFLAYLSKPIKHNKS